jgi:hypothetical protein
MLGKASKLKTDPESEQDCLNPTPSLLDFAVGGMVVAVATELFEL